MVTLAQLRDLRCAEFEEAADAWGKVSNQAGALRTRVDNEIITRLREEQEGEAAKQAMKRLERLSRNYQYIHVECGLIRTGLNGLATELAGSQRKLKAILEEARTHKLTVRGDGSVHYQVQAPLAPDLDGVRAGDDVPLTTPSGPKARAQDIADRIAATLADAAEIDARYARTLGRLRTNGDLRITTPMWDDALNDMNAVRKTVGDYLPADSIPQDKSAKENAAWWNGLTQEERDQYVSLHPASIGALDGIPAEVRDTANRTVLVESRADAQVKLDQLGPEPTKYIGPGKAVTSDWKEWDEEKTRLDAQLKGMDAIQDRFDQAGVDGLPEAYLLGFSPEGNGRAIIANGNPDTADHTAVYVPGTGSNLSKVGGDITRMTDLWRTASELQPGDRVSTVTWVGYDAPQDVVKDAPFSHYANDAAPTLNRFMDGLDTSHQPGTKDHTTLVGHSYGTTVIGSAARQGDLNADDVVFAGSPGVQVGRASDMDVFAGHVWNQEAEGDLVPEIGQFSHGHREWSWRTGADYVIPSDDRFGANQMATDTEGHSDYWKRGSLSLKNQAAVVTGNYDAVDHDD